MKEESPLIVTAGITLGFVGVWLLMTAIYWIAIGSNFTFFEILVAQWEHLKGLRIK